MKKQIGLWIDHRKAVIVIVTDDKQAQDRKGPLNTARMPDTRSKTKDMVSDPAQSGTRFVISDHNGKLAGFPNRNRSRS